MFCTVVTKAGVETYSKTQYQQLSALHHVEFNYGNPSVQDSCMLLRSRMSYWLHNRAAHHFWHCFTRRVIYLGDLYRKIVLYRSCDICGLLIHQVKLRSLLIQQLFKFLTLTDGNVALVYYYVPPVGYIKQKITQISVTQTKQGI